MENRELLRVDGLCTDLITARGLYHAVRGVSLQINEGEQQFILDHLPDDAGHLVSVHLHQGGFHLNFIHFILLWCI